MKNLMTGLDSFKNITNLLFGIMITIIAFFIQRELSRINTSLENLQTLMQQQLVVNAKTEGKLDLLDMRLKDHINSTIKK